ncbi:MAG: aminotransferase class I/II-fold pyridoxal phosphate-dependent enzyme [Pseudomonadota bacterium]
MTIPDFAPVIARLPQSVPFSSPEALQRACGVPTTLRIGANENLLGPSPAAVAALHATADEAWMYPDMEVYDLRSVLAEKYRTTLDRVLVGAGIDGLLDCFTRLFLSPGVVAVTTRGGYPTFAYHARAVGAEIVDLPYEKAKVPLEPMAAAAKAHSARIVYLSNPDNPTASYHDAETIRRFVNDLPENCACLLDEAYGEFASEDAVEADLSSIPHVIRLRTFSKAYGLAGLRVGYAIAHPDILQAANRVRTHFGKGRPALAAAMAAVGDHEWLSQTLASLTQSRSALSEALKEAGFNPLPSHTNFVTAETHRGAAYAEALVPALLNQGVFIRKPSAAPLDGCIRVTLPPLASIPVFKDALARAMGTLD